MHPGLSPTTFVFCETKMVTSRLTDNNVFSRKKNYAGRSVLPNLELPVSLCINGIKTTIDFWTVIFCSRSFCLFYDMQEHSTRIFHDMVNALTSFTQGLFTSQVTHSFSEKGAHLPSANTIQTPSSAPPPSVVALSAMGGVTPQPGFSYRGAWIPLAVMPVYGQAKPV